jgi:hemerythrin-like metal-binding protein
MKLLRVSDDSGLEVSAERHWLVLREIVPVAISGFFLLSFCFVLAAIILHLEFLPRIVNVFDRQLAISGYLTVCALLSVVLLYFQTRSCLSVLTKVYALSGANSHAARSGAPDSHDLASEASGTPGATSLINSAVMVNMCHELRTPLSGVISAAELLSVSGLDSGNQTIVEMLQISASALMGMLNNVLDLAKIESGRMTLEDIPFSVSSVFQEATRCLSAAAAAKGLVLRTEIDRRLPEFVGGDPVRLRQVMLNLIGNAVKFTETGYVAVEAGVLLFSADEVLVKCSVSDTGIGMSEEEQQYLFVPFAQADKSISRRYGGSGLGLSISKRLVELMDGRLSCTSKKGVGTRFSFELPFHVQAKAGSPGAPQDSLSLGSELATGFEDIDSQHLELLRRFSNLKVACRQGTGSAELLRLFDYLEDYVCYHFAAEEECMRVFDYPSYTDHRQAHREFHLRLQELRQQIDTEGPNLRVIRDSNQWLGEWLDSHVMDMDKKMAEFVLARSSSPSCEQGSS